MTQGSGEDSLADLTVALSAPPAAVPATAAPARVVGVDALRGLCALAVMAYHFSHWWPFHTPTLVHGAFEKAGIYGVEIFFVISGFSLYIASTHRDFSRQNVMRAFLVRRVMRILPLLFAVTAATVVMMLIGGYSVSAWSVLNNYLVIPLVVNPALALATGAWSLGVEWGFYLMFPMLMLLRERLLWLSGAGVIVLMLYAQLLRPSDLASQNELFVSIPNHLAFFLVGMALGRWRPPVIGGVAFLSLAALLLAGFVFIVPVVGDQAELVTGWQRLVFFILSVGMVAAFAAWRGGGSRVLVWLGNVSFGLYLLHPLAFTAVKHLLGPGVPTLVLAIALTIVASTVSFYGFERPIMNWGKRRSDVKRAQPETPA